TARGWAKGAVLILATGAYTDTLADSLRRTLILVRSAQVATVPLPAQLRASILPEGQAASDTCHLLRYFRLDASGRLIMGSRGSFDAVPVEPAARHHYRAVAEIYPQLEGIPYEYHWSGRVGLTRDHLPHLHEMAPGLLAALGYNGRGVAMATLMGQLLARRAQGEPAEELGFPFSAVKPIPLHRFSQLGTRMVVQYLRALDGIARLRVRLAMAAKTA
ncbi:MAG TPA: FAD-binding oxidoreductase, partial [Steroidobacteraceae bacterium]|nr:FAD-binding oxidoreductase [Steroidobacteraceae bacterium]